MTDTEAMFNSLVANAIDFMKRAAGELEQEPKHSVIDFYAGLELFLKARLLRDHWALVVAKPDKANLKRFLSGDFVSVNFEDAIYRLRHIVNEGVSTEEENSFNALREHRNKLVHFFHDKYTGLPDQSTIESVVSEQCKAWFYLHRLLTERWGSSFSNRNAQLEELDSVFRANRRYLNARWNALEPEVRTETRNGAIFFACNFCGFDAGKVEDENRGLYQTRCRVCGSVESTIRIPCPNCKSLVEADDVGEGKCETCDFELSFDVLADTLSESNVASPIAYCTCGYDLERTVVPFDESYLCLSCLETGTELNDCEWCSETHLGELEASYILGCTQCDGRGDDD